MPAVLSVRDLHVAFFTYFGVVRAVNGISFEIQANETLGIVGESGSGKSVTATAVMGLVEPPGAITGGFARLGDVDLFSLPEKQWAALRGERMTMCFQNPSRALNPVLRIGEQIDRVYRRHRNEASKQDAWQHAVHLLKEVNIADAERVMTRFPHQLSGGMCQRVMIVMALMCDPTLLILDEPTTGLDVTVQKQLLALLRNLRGTSDASQWLITHDLGVVANLCDRVVVMYAGQIMEEAPIDVLFSQPRHPYTCALLESIPQVNVRNQLNPIPGNVPEPLHLPSGCPFHPRCKHVMDVCRTVNPEFVVFEQGQRACCHLYAQQGDRDV